MECHVTGNIVLVECKKFIPQEQCYLCFQNGGQENTTLSQLVCHRSTAYESTISSPMTSHNLKFLTCACRCAIIEKCIILFLWNAASLHSARNMFLCTITLFLWNVKTCQNQLLITLFLRCNIVLQNDSQL